MDTMLKLAVAGEDVRSKQTPVLEVRDLGVSYYTDVGRATALDGVDLDL
jgi:hypothetical protein